MLHHFVWHHATVYHPQQAEKRTERLGEVDDKCGVIGGFETVYIAEYPLDCVAEGTGRVIENYQKYEDALSEYGPKYY